MLYNLKFLVILIFYQCFFVISDEDIDELVVTPGQDSSSKSTDISIDLEWRHSDTDFDYKKESIGGKDHHCYSPSNNNRITSVYHKNQLIWKTDNQFPKSVKAYISLSRKNFIIFEFSANNTKMFIQDFGFYYESGTAALDIGSKQGSDYFTFTKKGNDKNGELHYHVNKDKKITLIFKKKTIGKNILFWKATGSWFCKEVIVTIVSSNISQLALKLSDGSTNTDLVLTKQDGIWIRKGDVYLNTSKKEKATNCKYSSNIQNKNGTFEYEPLKGFKITRVSDGDKGHDIVWQSSGSDHCTNVTGTVANNKTVKFTLDLTDESGSKRKRFFEKHEDTWVEVDERKTNPKTKSK